MTLENFLESCWTPSFWPHEAIFEVRIKPSCDYTFTAGPDLMCPSSSASNSDDFPFFWILYCSSRTQVISVGSSVNICRNFSHIRADDDYGDLWFVMMMMMIIIIITRPWPAFGRLGLGGSSGVYSSHGQISHVSLRACGAQLGGKSTCR